jgi:hypothetical protein
VFRIPVGQIVLPAVLLFGVGSARAQSTDAQAVNAANTAFYAALSAGDATAMSKVYAHDDFVMVVSPNGKPEGPAWPAVEAWAKGLALSIRSLRSSRPLHTLLSTAASPGWWSPST